MSTQQAVSQRSILLKRAQKHNISQRLRNSLQHIEFRESRLSSSRVSRVSSQSAKSNRERRSFSSAQLREVSPKVKLLQEISQKLRQVRERELQRDSHSPQRAPMVIKQSSSSPRVKAKGGKLQSMLKDIKKCNQMSTKAVTSIKRRINGLQIWSNSAVSVPFPINEKDQDKPQQLHTTAPAGGQQQISMNEIEIIQEEMRRVKEENKLLLKLVQLHQLKSSNGENKKGDACRLCGCTCKSKFNVKHTNYKQLKFQNFSKSLTFKRH